MSVNFSFRGLIQGRGDPGIPPPSKKNNNNNSKKQKKTPSLSSSKLEKPIYTMYHFHLFLVFHSHVAKFDFLPKQKKTKTTLYQSLTLSSTSCLIYMIRTMLKLYMFMHMQLWGCPLPMLCFSYCCVVDLHQI